jgi:hypothetical protein
VHKKAEVEIRPEPDQEQWRLQVNAAKSGNIFLGLTQALTRQSAILQRCEFGSGAFELVRSGINIYISGGRLEKLH